MAPPLPDLSPHAEVAHGSDRRARITPVEFELAFNNSSELAA